MDDVVYKQVKTLIKRNIKIDLENYKADQMKRRLDSWLSRSKVNEWNAYFHLLTVDPGEFERFRNFLTINVTEFFRDISRWNSFRIDILPYLIKNYNEKHGNGGLKIWSAGCSIGTEAYTLAIILEEDIPFQRYTMLATDLDRGALQRAREGGPYRQEDIRNLTEEQRKKYLTSIPSYQVNEKLMKNIRFEEQDLMNDKFDGGFDLIVCRNVIIYFTIEAKEKLYAKFSASLRPGGVLFIGATEIISDPVKYGLQNFGISYYKKI